MLSAELQEQDAVCSHPWLVKLDKEKKNTHTGEFIILITKKSLSNSSRRGATASNQNHRCEFAWGEETKDEGKEGGRADEPSWQ